MPAALITKETDYAIRALGFLAQKNGASASVAEIAKALQVSYPFLRKIMQQLNRQGILRSVKGKGGGFGLVKAADQIFVMDIMHIFQGPIELKRCEMKHHICPHVQTCALHQKIKEIEAYAAHILQGVTIQHIAEGVDVLL